MPGNMIGAGNRFESTQPKTCQCDVTIIGPTKQAKCALMQYLKVLVDAFSDISPVSQTVCLGIQCTLPSPPKSAHYQLSKKKLSHPGPLSPFKALLLSSRRVASLPTQCTLPTFDEGGHIAIGSLANTTHSNVLSRLKFPLIDGAVRLLDLFQIFVCKFFPQDHTILCLMFWNLLNGFCSMA